MSRSTQAILSAAIAGILAAGLLAVGNSAAFADRAHRDHHSVEFPRGTAPAPTPPRAREQVVLRRTGRLTEHATGQPTGTGARRLNVASVLQDVQAARVSATIELAGVPTSATDATIDVEFGYLEGNTCQGDSAFLSTTLTPTDGFTRSGSTLKLSAASSAAAYSDWNCAFAVLSTADGATVYDALVGGLTPTYAVPQLKIERVRRQNLVTGSTTKIDVSVRNSGLGEAENVYLSGRGKGIKVTRTKVPYLSNDYAAEVELPVKLLRGKKSKVKLVLTATGARATSSFVVRRTAPPKRPVPGAYASKSKHVEFKIDKRGRVVGLRGYLYGSCGVYPNGPFPMSGYYSFPTTKVPRNGIINVTRSYDLYSVSLEMTVHGSKVTKGGFYYSGPNYCYASTGFSARRRR